MNDVTLREYIEALLNERQKRVDQLERDARFALEKAENALERRLDLLNEFRAQSSEELAPLKVQAARSQSTLAALETQLDALKERVDMASGSRAMLVSGVSAMLAILAIAVQFVR